MADVGIKFQAIFDSNPFLAGQQRIVSMMQGLKSEWSTTAGSIMSTAAGVAGVFSTVAAAAGLVSFKNILVGAIQSADQLDELAQQSGMTVEGLSGINSVARVSGTALETVAAASNKLSLALAKTDEDSAGTAQAIKALGLNFDEFVKQAPEQRLSTVAQAMAEFEDGAGKTAVAMALFGKSGAELLPLLNDLAAAGELQGDTNAEQAAAAANLSDNWARLRISGTAWRNSMANAMIPTLDEALKAVLKVVNGTGGLREEVNRLAADGSIARWTRSAVTGLSYVIDGVQMAVRAFDTIGKAIAAGAAQVVSYFSGVGEAIKRAFSGDFSGAAAAMRGGMSEALAIGKAYVSDFQEIWSGATLGDRFRAALEASGAAGPSPAAARRTLTPNLTAPEKAKKEKDEKEKPEPSAMGTYEAVLAEQRRAQAILEGGREFTKEQELAFWREILSTYEVSSKDRTGIVRKMADMEVAIMREKARQIGQLDAEALRAQQERALAAVEMAQLDAAAQFQAGDLSRAQLLDADRRFEEQRLAIRMDYLQQRRTAIDPDRDPVAYQQNNLQIEELERQHQMRLRQIQIAQEADRMDNPMLRTLQTMTEAMGQAAGQILTRQQSLAAGLRSIWQGTRQAIAGEIQRIVAAKVLAFARERVLALAGIGVKAAEAGAGAAASQAAIPVVGPALALGAMATVMAAVMGLGGSIPSAARGWDIPAGVNPLAQLHEQEMVLPAEQANVIRDMATGGGGGAAQPAAVLRTVGTMGDFLMVHRHDLAKVLKVINRDSLRG
jgi:hypothetical protein